MQANDMNEVLSELDRILAERKQEGTPSSSYTALLYNEGLDKILRKVSEESTETILAAKECERDKSAMPHLTEEVADLWFHSLVMLAYLGGDSTQVLNVLKNRMRHKDAGRKN
jgi:phosphoribosyl-ATP pyrophosphohydrolase